MSVMAWGMSASKEAALAQLLSVQPVRAVVSVARPRVEDPEDGQTRAAELNLDAPDVREDAREGEEALAAEGPNDARRSGERRAVALEDDLPGLENEPREAGPGRARSEGRAGASWPCACGARRGRCRDRSARSGTRRRGAWPPIGPGGSRGARCTGRSASDPRRRPWWRGSRPRRCRRRCTGGGDRPAR
jgi:hypothetical protein